MKRTIGFILTGLCALSTTPARAQVNAQLAAPVASDAFFVTPDARLPKQKLTGGAYLSVNYGRLPLQLHTDAGNQPVITDLTTADLVLQLGLYRRFRLELTLPYSSSSSADGTGHLGMGDSRLSAQATLVDPAKHAIGLALRPFVVLPSGDVDYALSEGRLSPGAMLVAHRQGERLQLAAAVGARALEPVDAASARQDQLLGTLGLSVAVGPQVRLGAEVFGATDLLDPFGRAGASPLEALGSVHVTVRPGVVAALGAGTALTDGAGGPRFRGFLQVGVTLPGAERDRDRDGLADSVDACPEEAEDVDLFRDEDGCPERDNDGDGFIDAQDRCMNDPEDADGFLDEDGCPELDNDSDGVVDAKDRCPLEPEDRDGFQDEDGCLERDNDGDGFFDAEDECINVAEDFDGFKDLDGCPEPDNDADGLADVADRCPNEPEDSNGVNDDDGCPDEGQPLEKTCAKLVDGNCLDADAALPINQRLHLATPVRFELDSTELSVPVRAALDQLVLRLRALPEGLRLTVAGHCDDLGTDEYNDQLSVHRAEAVRNYLVAHGVDERRIDITGYGRRIPLVRDTSDEARAANRRVELWVLSGKSSKPLQISSSQ